MLFPGFFQKFSGISPLDNDYAVFIANEYISRINNNATDLPLEHVPHLELEVCHFLFVTADMPLVPTVIQRAAWPECVVFQPPFFNQHLCFFQRIEDLPELDFQASCVCYFFKGCCAVVFCRYVSVPGRTCRRR
jgi:hypothetical protein